MAIPPNLKRIGYPCHIYMKKKKSTIDETERVTLLRYKYGEQRERIGFWKGVALTELFFIGYYILNKFWSFLFS